jgi:YHS domain-containing protein
MRESVSSRREILVRGAGIALMSISGLTLGVSVSHAREPQVFTGIVKGIAVGGYDPVAYFTAAKPVPGKPEFTHVHDGATWRFASAANRDMFVADPTKYAPQYGGYCAWAVSSQNYTAKGDPNAWSIVGGKLFLNYNKDVQKTWEQNTASNISLANGHWPKVLDKPIR